MTDGATVRRLQDAVDRAARVASSDECVIDEVTYVFLVAGTRAAFFTFDLTACDAWMMPQGVIVPGTFAADLKHLS